MPLGKKDQKELPFATNCLQLQGFAPGNGSVLFIGNWYKTKDGRKEKLPSGIPEGSFLV